MEFNRHGREPTRHLGKAGIACTVATLAIAVGAYRHRALRRQRDRLVTHNRAKDDLIATLSHELRTPLTSILGWIEILREASPDERTWRLALESIEQSTRTQKLLVDDLLDESRILRGTLPLATRPLPLQEPLAEALLVFQPEATAKGISLGYRAPAEPLLVTGDHHRLKQVAWNLLSNALKFTPKGGSVDVTVTEDAGTAVVSVRDTGAGIDPAILPDLFQRFRQGRAAVGKGGLGLGLALCRHIVELHGGAIDIESEGIGCGARATVRLPIAAR